jgi:hypothetical protein
MMGAHNVPVLAYATHVHAVRQKRTAGQRRKLERDHVRAQVPECKQHAGSNDSEPGGVCTPQVVEQEAAKEDLLDHAGQYGTREQHRPKDLVWLQPRNIANMIRIQSECCRQKQRDKTPADRAGGRGNADPEHSRAHRRPRQRRP